MRIPILRAAYAAMVCASLLPVAAHAEELLDQYAATDRFRSGQPHAFVVTPDGAEVLFLRSGPRDRVNDVWALELASGRERVVLTAQQILKGAEETLSVEERARRERLRMSARGIATFELSRDGRRLLIPLSGKLYVVERAGGAVRELPSEGAAAEDPRFSPDGATVSYVRGGDVHLIDVAAGTERSLTRHFGDRESWGEPEFVAQEEMDRFQGYWWSPDSKFLAVQHTDESHVERLRIADPFQPASAPVEFAYPRPGRENAIVTLALIPAGGGATHWIAWDHAKYPYLCKVEWSDQGPLTLLVMNREQTEEAVLTCTTPPCDTCRGLPTRTLMVERDPAWLNLAHGSPHWIEGGRAFLWVADRDDSGPWLERRGADGAEAGRLTPKNLRVENLLAVDEARGVAYVSASDDPIEQHVWRVWLKGRRAPERLSREPGLDDATFSRDGSASVRGLSPVHGTKRWVVVDPRGAMKGEVKSVAEKPPFEANVEWTTVGADSLRAFILRPRNFDPRRRYPVIDAAYAGPTSQRVTHRAGAYLIDQWLADQGFIVVTVDGRGTPARGRSWERAIRGDFIGPALADHLAGLRALCARYPEMDASRIGVTGWSFGGYYTVLALERAGDVYKAGVAGAPVVDWRDYDTFYTERYIGQPQGDSLAYARSSALTDAAKLSRPLLVIHGTADDNVYFFHTLKLADALNRANRTWSMLPLPGQTHGVIEAAQVRQVYGRLAEFFRHELGGTGDAAPPMP